jgi:hypothetical protein
MERRKVSAGDQVVQGFESELLAESRTAGIFPKKLNQPFAVAKNKGEGLAEGAHKKPTNKKAEDKNRQPQNLYIGVPTKRKPTSIPPNCLGIQSDRRLRGAIERHVACTPHRRQVGG